MRGVDVRRKMGDGRWEMEVTLMIRVEACWTKVECKMEDGRQVDRGWMEERWM